MRVGLLIYGSLDTVSGGYLYDRFLVRHLQEKGHQVEVFSLPRRSYGRHLGDNFSLALYRSLCRARLDVLLQDELNHPSLFGLNRWLKKRVAYPLLAIVHHLRCCEARPAWQNLGYRWVERRYLETLDGFIFNSQTTRAAVEGLIGGGKRAVVAYPGGDRLGPTLTPGEIADRAQKPGPLRVLFVGNLIPRKELHTLLSALARLPRKSWQLEVVGSLKADPAYVQRILRQIQKAGLEDRVRLWGPLSDAELTLHLAQSHLLAVPSSYEGYGIVYLEGMGFGLPALASTAGAASEIITPGQNGFLVDPGDEAALAQRVYELSQNRSLLVEMSLAAQKRYLSHPTWTQSMGQIESFLETFPPCPSPKPTPSPATLPPKRA